MIGPFRYPGSSKLSQVASGSMLPGVDASVRTGLPPPVSEAVTRPPVPSVVPVRPPVSGAVFAFPPVPCGALDDPPSFRGSATTDSVQRPRVQTWPPPQPPSGHFGKQTPASVDSSPQVALNAEEPALAHALWELPHTASITHTFVHTPHSQVIGSAQSAEVLQDATQLVLPSVLRTSA
jgi:hypothetical protein